MVTPGRRNKGNCPSDIHLRLSDEQRQIIDGLGPGRYQDKIAKLILDGKCKATKLSQTEIEMKLIELGKEKKEIIGLQESLSMKLESDFGLTPEQIDEAYIRINDGIKGGELL